MIQLHQWTFRLIAKPKVLMQEPCTEILIQHISRMILILKYRLNVSLLTQITLLNSSTFSIILIVVSKGKWHPLKKRIYNGIL